MNASLLNLMSCIDLYIIEKVFLAIVFSIHCVNTSGLKLNFEKGISIQCFRRRPQQVSLRPLHYDVECFDSVSYTHLRAHETSLHLVCRLLLEKIW